jgi:hypothetical protein
VRTDRLPRPCARGFSTIELITFIIIAGIFVPLAYIAFSAATKSATVPEHVITARFIAEQKIEDITKNAFDSITIESTSYAAVPGYTNYEWKWTVAQLTSSDHSSVSPAITDYTNYKKITVYVKTPDNFEFVAYTVATKRPG